MMREAMIPEVMRTEAGEVDLVVFTVDGVPCALRIDEVQEIKRLERITPVHRSPEYIRGIVNLRGRIVSIIDLRVKLNYQPGEAGPESRMVVVERGVEKIGLLVDSIEDAVVAQSREIQIPPSNIHGAEARFFKGVYQTPDTLVAILDLHVILEKDASDEGP